jgi:elongation factor P
MKKPANLIKKFTLLFIDNDYWMVEEFQHIKPGKGHAFIRVKLKAMHSNKIVNRKIQSNSKVDIVNYHIVDTQFLYRDGEEYFSFLNTKSYEIHRVHRGVMAGDTIYLVDESIVCTAYITESNEIISVKLPNMIVIKIEETVPGKSSERISTAVKMAVASNNIKVKVPSFIKIGDFIKISTETGEYVEKL